MELSVVAPAAGIVSAVLVAAGELVSAGQRLIEVEA
jgi:biotin carboxyl carrier protein